MLSRSFNTGCLASISFRLSPVVVQLEVISGEGRREEFEHVQYDSARIDLLEHRADRLLGRLLGENDHGHLVPDQVLEDLVVEALPPLGARFAIHVGELDVAVLPVEEGAHVEGVTEREHLRGAFLVGVRVVGDHGSAEVLAEDSVLRHCDDCLLTIPVRIQACRDAEVVPPGDLLLLRVGGLDRLPRVKRLKQRGHPLLAVQEQFFGVGAAVAFHSRDQSRAKPEILAYLKAHQNPNRVVERDAR